MKSQLITEDKQTVSEVIQLPWKKTHLVSETAHLFPWKATASEKCPAVSFCIREGMSQLTSGSVIDGFGLPGALLERPA